MYMVIVAILRFFVNCLLFWRLRVEIVGKENIPKKGPVVIVFNHTDYLDPVFIMISVKRNLWALVASEYSRHPFVSIFKILKRAILVKRTEFDQRAIDSSLKVLKYCNFLAVSPEGTRSKNGVLQKGKLGPAYLAGMTDSYILPIGVVGTFGLSSKLLDEKKVVKINIGESFKLSGVEDLRKDTGKANKTGTIKDKMVVLRKWRDVTNSQIMPRISDLLPADMGGIFS